MIISGLSTMTRFHNTDLVVVGGGAAGCIAAIAAREKGASVTVVDKAVVVRSGSAGGGEKDIACHLNEGEPWDTDGAARAWLLSGATGNYPFLESAVADINVRKIREVVDRLESYGLEFRRDEEGRYFRSQAIGTPGRYLLWFKNGHEFKKRLERQTRLAGVTLLERVYVSQLLVDGSGGQRKVLGAVGFDIVDGEVHAISAKSVILATGEAIRLYSNNQTSNPWSTWHSPYNNGSAQALAFEAGAEITGLEFTRTTIHPLGLGATGSAVFFGFGGYLLNSRGERYMSKYHPMLEKAPRDFLAFATQMEVEEGRGPCFVDLRHLSSKAIETMIELQTKEFLGYKYYYDQVGIDLSRDLLPVEVGSLFAAGGVLINGECQTSIAGLYAAGDCTHARAGLPMALATGLEAGEQAAGYSKSREGTPAKELFSEEAVLEPMKRGNGLTPQAFMGQLNRVMDANVGWHRTEKSLKDALAQLSELGAGQKHLVARDFHDLMRVYEAMHLFTVARLITMGALERRETRGWHRRDDYPAEDERLRGHIILQKADGDEVRKSFRSLGA